MDSCSSIRAGKYVLLLLLGPCGRVCVRACECVCVPLDSYERIHAVDKKNCLCMCALCWCY